MIVLQPSELSALSNMTLHQFLFSFSLKAAKLQSIKSPAEKGNLDATIEPYRSDNAKLVKENNELHQQLIKSKEDLEVSSKGKTDSQSFY